MTRGLSTFVGGEKPTPWRILQDLEACRQSMLPYGNQVRTLQIDMVAFDNADNFIRAYEIKRGNGQFDAGKIRSITRDLKCIQVLLNSCGEF